MQLKVGTWPSAA